MERSSDYLVLSDALRAHALAAPDRRALSFLTDGQASAQLTYAQLAQRAAATAQALRERGLVGKPVLLLFPAGPDYLCALLGCFWAGAIAVPAYPPSRRGGRVNLRVAQVIADTHAEVALTNQAVAQTLTDLPELAGCALLAIDPWFENTHPQVERARDPQAPALLQYTSGSIAAPKGVILSQGQLLAGLSVIGHSLRDLPEGPMVTWLPPYHDMGLIGTLLWPILAGRSIVQLSPESFVRRPIRWLRALSEHRGVVSAVPNFALDLCVRRIPEPERAELDLSALKTLFIGAEPVRAETVSTFLSAYAQHGLAAEALAPSFGMAEATLLVTGHVGARAPRVLECSARALATGIAQPPRTGDVVRSVVGCGVPGHGLSVRIVEPTERRVLGEREVGEIWVQGASVASGYWQRPEVSEATFAARLDTSAEGPFLRTGDLGFMAQGELFVMGRIKDVIIVRGVKHHAHDLETTVQALHPALLRDAGAAFGCEHDGDEQVCIVQELDPRDKPDTAALLQAIVQAVQEQHAIKLHAVVLVKRGAIAKTASGKVMRAAVKAAYAESTLPVSALWLAADVTHTSVTQDQDTGVRSIGAVRRIAAIEHFVRAKVAARAKLSPSEIALDVPLANYGIDSLATLELTEDLECWLGSPVPAPLLTDHPSISALAQALVRWVEPTPVVRASTPVQPARDTREPIAIVGMACRFPGARDLRELWQLLQQGKHAVTKTPASRSLSRLPTEHTRPHLAHAHAFGGFVEQLEDFDAGFFGITAREAARMDPQQRLFLEVVWEALEDACLPPSALRKTAAGVFAAVCGSDHALLHAPEHSRIDTDFGLGHAASVVANRVSYFLDLKGPSVSFDGACASSLIALHHAVSALHEGDTELAIVGGVNAVLAPQPGLFLANARALSSDGRCKTFDAAADGFVRSEGCGVLILKRLSAAVADGDRVYALVQGSAMGHNGMTQGLMTPSVSAQVQLIERALGKAQISASALDYIEAHGVGTALADTQELRALLELLAAEPRAQPCYLGSVKTNLGHLEAAAGIASVIKTALALANEELPAHLHLESAHELLRQSPAQLRVPTKRVAWPRSERPRYAGVSAFGIGGANAHVVLGEAPPARVAADASTSAGPYTLCLSARSDAALVRLALQYAARCTEQPLADLCFSALTGRQHFQRRVAIVANDARELRARLIDFAKRGRDTATPARLGSVGCALAPDLAPLSAARQLYERLPAFARAFDRACGWLESELLTHTSASDSQKLGLAASYAQWCTTVQLGLQPDLVCGRAEGAYLAACAAGALDWPTGLRLALCHLRGEPPCLQPTWTPARITLWLGGTRIPIGTTPVTERLSAGIDNAWPHNECESWWTIGAGALADGRQLSLSADYAAWQCALASWYSAGLDLDWSVLTSVSRKCSLPHYPFERERHWLEPLPPTAARTPLSTVGITSTHPLLRAAQRSLT